MVDEVVSYCEQMVEVVVEVNEELMDKYFEEGELFIDEIKKGLCMCILVNEIVVVICGFVFKNKGVQVVLDFVVEFLLVLDEVKVICGEVDEDGIEEFCFVDDEVLFVVLVFKIVIDLFVGILMFFWVYFGKLEFGNVVFNFVKGKKECVGCMVQMYFKDCQEIKEVLVGDIVVVIGLKSVIIGDILCDENYKIIFECMEFFDLVIFVVVELKFKVDQEKMGVVLGKLV